MHAQWLKERFTLDWPGEHAALAVLRARLAELTHLPSACFKIIHAGAVMKDDNAPLSAYSLTPTSTLVVIGKDGPPPPPQNSSPAEQHTLALIRAELATVQRLAQDVHAFRAALSPPIHSPPSSADHARTGELLLQSLLRLDAIVPDRNWSNARAERKAAVQETQQLLDSLDAAWQAYSPPH